MALEIGGEVLLQFMQEMRDFRQETREFQVEVRTNFTRVDRELASLRQNVDEMRQTLNMVVDGLTGLTQEVHTTRDRHEKYFEKIGRSLNELAEQRTQDRATLNDHERRLAALEQS